MRAPEKRHVTFGNAAYNPRKGIVKFWGDPFRPQKEPVAGLRAEVVAGDNLGDYISAGRVIAGGLLAGPAGMAVGALARRNDTRMYVVISRGDEVLWTVEGSAKHQSDARLLADAINAAS